MLPETIETAADVRQFFQRLANEEHLSFHPDTPFAEYVNMGTGEPTYQGAEIHRRDHLMSRCFIVLGDGVYDVALEVLQCAQS